MKFENIKVMNFENAIRGMRHPKLSYHLSDSKFGIDHIDYCEADFIVAEKWYDYLKGDALTDDTEDDKDKQICELSSWLRENGVLYSSDYNCIEYAFLGPNDLDLMQRLIKGGPEHRKFMRQIFVSVDITAPLYW